MKRTIAAFDFDGTLTYEDVLLPFLSFLFGRWKVGAQVAMLTPSLAQFLFGSLSRQELKERFLTPLIQGMPSDLFASHAEQFAKNRIEKFLRPEALQRMQWHKEQGHTVVIISANLMPIVEPFAKAKGADAAIASILQEDSQKNLTGKLHGLNCWGREKIVRLAKLFGPKEEYMLYAYGDSRGDKELLELADYPYYRYFPNQNREN